MLWVVCLAAIVPALGSILLYLFDPEEFEEGVVRAVYLGHYGDPNRLAGCLALSIPAIGYLFRTTRSEIGRLALVAVGGNSLVAIVLTGSRGGMLALFAGVFMMIWLSRHRVVGSVAAVVIAVLAVAVMPSGLMDRYSQMNIRKVAKASTAQTRWRIWMAGFEMAAEHPVLGVGTGNYENAAYKQYMESTVTEGGQRWRPAHSSFIKILSENGAPALLLFVILHIVSFKDLLRLRRASMRKWGRDGPICGLSTALIAVFATVTVAALTIDYTDDLFPYLFIGAVAALKDVGRNIGLIA